MGAGGENEKSQLSSHDLRIETPAEPSLKWVQMLACPAKDVSEMEHLEMSVPDRNYKHVLRLRGGRKKREGGFFDLRQSCFASCFWDVPVWMHIHSSWGGGQGSGDVVMRDNRTGGAGFFSEPHTYCLTVLIMTTRAARTGSVLGWKWAPDSFKSLIYTSEFQDAWKIGCNAPPAHGILTCYF